MNQMRATVRRNSGGKKYTSDCGQLMGFAAVRLGQVEIVPIGVKKLPSIGRPSTVMAGYVSQAARRSSRQGAQSKNRSSQALYLLTL